MRDGFADVDAAIAAGPCTARTVSEWRWMLRVEVTRQTVPRLGIPRLTGVDNQLPNRTKLVQFGISPGWHVPCYLNWRSHWSGTAAWVCPLR